MFPRDIIRKKRDKETLSKEEIFASIDGLGTGEFKDYQASALLMAPVALFMLTTPSIKMAYAAAFFYNAFSSCWIGSAVATPNELVLPRMRGTASAFYILSVTFIGLAMGPFTVGRVSDVLARGGADGGDALRTAMTIAPPIPSSLSFPFAPPFCITPSFSAAYAPTTQTAAKARTCDARIRDRCKRGCEVRVDVPLRPQAPLARHQGALGHRPGKQLVSRLDSVLIAEADRGPEPGLLLPDVDAGAGRSRGAMRCPGRR